MPNQITLTVSTGTPPYNIYVCDITNTYCYFATTFGGGTITFDSPAPLEYTTPILIKIVDSAGCETFELYQCIPTPTPTLTPTLTPTATGPCGCCCIEVSSNNSTIGSFTYRDCFGNVFNNVFVPPYSTVYYCGSNVTNLENVILNYGSPCVNGNCIPSTPTPTPTPTPTSAPIIPTCSVLINNGNNIYAYFPSSNTNVFLGSSFPPFSPDIAHTTTKLWMYNYSALGIYEYDITLSPWSATFNRTIAYPSGVILGAGLGSITDTQLISSNTNTIPNEIIVLDITTSTAVPTVIGTLGSGRVVSGDILLTTTNKILVTNENSLNSTYLTQYSYPSGAFEVEVDITSTTPLPWGIFIDSGNIYVCNSGGQIYNVNVNFPYTQTLFNNSGILIGGASQVPSCCDTNLNLTPCPDPFISVWTTTSPSETINLPYSPSGVYDGTIDWGDGSPTSINDYTNRSHTYAIAGTYTITINGEITNFNFGLNDPTNVTNLISVTQWGSCFNIVSGFMAFENCSSLTLTSVTDILDLTNVLTTVNMFAGCTQLTTVNNMNSWDVSSVTDMNSMFAGCLNFNQPLNSWVVSGVTDMGNMFANCLVFNQPLNSWVVSSVTNMGLMFSNCFVFNRPLNSWIVSGVTNMSTMFYNCNDFNQNISSWDVSSVLDMSYMFGFCYVFNLPLNSWDVSSVLDMSFMFFNCNQFNRPLNSWVVSSVTNMSYMFISCFDFNQDISSWDVSSVTTMSNMFGFCLVFNQPLNSWVVSGVTNMSNMFEQCYQFNRPLNSWDVSSVTNMSTMFYSCFAFNQNISSWDVSSVTNMSAMFYGCIVFNRDLSTWCVQNILSLPTNFDFGATSWILPKPIWGIASSPPC